MLSEDAIVRAVNLQSRSYELLKWMADAVTRGFIRFNTAHDYATLPHAAEEWIHRHYQDIPLRARPEKEDIADFSKLFATYLENSFELRENPGKHLYSDGNHCFCPMCAWLRDAPRLVAKKVEKRDKRHAQKMKATTVDDLALEIGVALSADRVESILTNKELRAPLAMVTYAHDLQNRLRGRAVGPATLVLWRQFAWTPDGAPRKNFTLNAEDVLENERVLIEAIRGKGAG